MEELSFVGSVADRSSPKVERDGPGSLLTGFRGHPTALARRPILAVGILLPIRCFRRSSSLGFSRLLLLPSHWAVLSLRGTFPGRRSFSLALLTDVWPTRTNKSVRLG